MAGLQNRSGRNRIIHRHKGQAAFPTAQQDLEREGECQVGPDRLSPYAIHKARSPIGGHHNSTMIGSGDMRLQGLDRNFPVAGPERLDQLLVVGMNIDRLIPACQVDFPEMAAHARHNRRPNGEEVRLARALQQ
jgi:hypothetical protein